MNTARSNPDSVSTVNSTPEAPTSDRTIRWTPAERATSWWSKPWCTRYAIARSLYSEANTLRMAASTLSMPLMLRNVSC